MSAYLFDGWVPGAPRGKGSVRVGANGIAYKDKLTEAYMRAGIMAFKVAHAGKPAIIVPTVITILAYLPRSKEMTPNPSPRVRTEQPPAIAFPAPVKPDVDNMQKALLDCLTQAGVIVDDCRVVGVHVAKLYHPIGQPVGVRVMVAAAPGCWSKDDR